MRFQCHHCQTIVDIADSERGKPVRCGKCTRIVTVPESPLAPNAIINDFIIQRCLGEGGMGTVFLAHQISLDRPVALKVLLSELSQDANFVSDFVKEARSAARLNHPNIVQAHAVGGEHGIYFFAMEYVQGRTLKEVLEIQNRLPPEEAIKIGQQIAGALDHAWREQKLVHRDIKPDNIMMTERGIAKLMDLGLARAAHELAADDSAVIFGTPQYVCPEYLLGQALDCRSDIYSLGATLYQTLTGQYAFSGKNPHETASMHVTHTLVPPHEVNPAVPEAVSWMICKMMARQPEDRYRDHGELVQDFERWLGGQSPVGCPVPNPSAEPQPVAVRRAPGARSGRIQIVRKAGSASRRLRLSPSPAASTGGAPPAAGEAAAGSRRFRLVTGQPAAAPAAASVAPAAPPPSAPPPPVAPPVPPPVGDDEPDTTVVMPPSGPGAAARPAARGAGRPPAPARARRWSGRTGLILALIAVLIGVGAGVTLAVGQLRERRQLRRYQVASADEAKALYFRLRPAGEAERRASDEVFALMRTPPPTAQERAYLENVLRSIQGFREHFPDSVFLAAPEQVDCRQLLAVPPAFWPRVRTGLEAQVRSFAGSLAAPVSDCEERLIRLCRHEAHDAERQTVVAPNRQLAQSQAAIRQAVDAFRQFQMTHLNQRQQVVAAFGKRLKTKETQLQQERQELRDKIWAETREMRFPEALAAEARQESQRAKWLDNLGEQAQEARKDQVLATHRDQVLAALKAQKDLPADWAQVQQQLTETIDQRRLDEQLQALAKLAERDDELLAERDQWFRAQRQALEEAQRFHLLVANTQRRFADVPIRPSFALPEQDKAQIALIQREEILVNLLRYDDALHAPAVYKSETMPLKNLDTRSFLELARKGWDADRAGTEDDYTRFQAAWLLYTGRLLEARALLDKQSGDKAAFLLAELQAAEPAWRRQLMDTSLGRIAEMVKAGQAARARDYYDKLKASFGSTPEFKKRDAELQQALSAPKP